MTEAEIRSLFPGTRNSVYLDAAACSLLPQPVADRMHATAGLQTDRGVLAYGEEKRLIEETRKAAALSIGADTDEIAFTSGTTEGIGKIADGLDWREGDEVVLADLEYPGNVYPWAAQRRRGARLRFVRGQGGRVEPERYLAAIGPRTRVVAVSHVQFSSGYRIDLKPLAEACERRGILLLVDAIQSLGAVSLEAQTPGIAAVAVAARKWLLGPTGSGFLYVARKWIERIRPGSVGARSVRNAGDFMQYVDRIDDDGQLDMDSLLSPTARRFEAGFTDPVGVAGLHAALELGERIGRQEVKRRIAILVSRLVETLEAAGFPVAGPRTEDERAGIVSFSVPGSPEPAYRGLRKAGYALALRDGRLRVAPHVYNTLDEVDGLTDAVREQIR